MSTFPQGGPSPSTVLATLPSTLRDELLTAFNEIVRNFREQRWEPSELNGGKLCEVIYSIIRGHVDGSLPAHAQKPRNMLDACRALEQADATQFSRSARIQIPRILVALYEVRNNRGVGHVGGEVDPNPMDAALVLAVSKWLVAELIRMFHSVDTVTAEEIVESITERTAPLIWRVGNTQRVLSTTMSMREKTLVLLYHSQGWVSEHDLVEWVEHSNPAAFRRDVLRKAHKDRVIEYDRAGSRATLSPLGIRLVEEKLLAP